MIVKKFKTHYHVELFNHVVLNKDDPIKSWISYCQDVTRELVEEVNRSQYALGGIAPQSHIIVPDGDTGEKGILDAILKKYNYV